MFNHIKAATPAISMIGARTINNTAPTVPINSPTLVSSQVSMPPHMKYRPSPVSGSITLSQHFPLHPYVCCRLFTASSSVSLCLRTYFTPPSIFFNSSMLMILQSGSIICTSPRLTAVPSILIFG